MERQQNIRQASTRHVAKNFTLDGFEIEQNASGGVVVGRTTGICHSCGGNNVDCCL